MRKNRRARANQERQRVLISRSGTKITYEDYYKCLFNDKVAIREQRTIATWHHNLYTEEELKEAWSGHDHKRYLLPNSTDTIAWGHYKISSANEQEEEEEEEKEEEELPRKGKRNK